MQIAELMTRDPVSCTPTCSAQVAADLMRVHDTGVLPVVFNLFSRKLLGVVTDRDLCMMVVSAGRDPAHVTVQECMTANVVACSPEDDAQVAIRLLQENQVRRLPVVNRGGSLVGMLSLADLIRHGAIDPKDLYLTLRKVCEPAGAPSLPRKRAAQKVA